MTITSVADLASRLREYHLLDAAQLNELGRTLQSQFPDPRALGRELIRRGWLTPFQGNQLFQGKGAGLVLGSYVLLDRLGEGGMGAVYKARHWKLGKVVALKLVRKERLSSPDAARRFQREMRAAAALNHPNVVLAYDADEVAGTNFYTMEYVAGTDLARLVQARGPLPVAEACEFVRQAALGLQHAFERGMVHRDIKPSNLLLAGPAGSAPDATLPALTRPGSPCTVKVLDLGLARLSHADDADSSSSMTGEGTVMGTLDYLAPEQAKDAHGVDIRADLYSLGCTLYFLLTGRPPFPESSGVEKLYRHRYEEPAPLEQLRPDVPPVVVAVVRRLMAKDPADRYQTPAEAAAALAAVGGVASAPLAVPAAASQTVAAEPRHGFSSLVPGDSQAAPDSRDTLQRAAAWQQMLIFNAVGGFILLLLLLIMVVSLWRQLQLAPPQPGPERRPPNNEVRSKPAK